MFSSVHSLTYCLLLSRSGEQTPELLEKLLTINPKERITAAQALEHDYFWTDPLPADPKTCVSEILCRHFTHLLTSCVL